MEGTYRTRSFYEAAYLVTVGFEIIGKDEGADGKGKTSLVFRESKDLLQAVLNFYNNTATVKVKQYVDNYRNLKDFVFE